MEIFANEPATQGHLLVVLPQMAKGMNETQGSKYYEQLTLEKTLEWVLICRHWEGNSVEGFPKFLPLTTVTHLSGKPCQDRNLTVASASNCVLM